MPIPAFMHVSAEQAKRHHIGATGLAQWPRQCPSVVYDLIVQTLLGRSPPYLLMPRYDCKSSAIISMTLPAMILT